MPHVACNGIEIAYELSGPEDGLPLLLLHGVGAQLTRWPPSLLDALAERGFRVIRMDNRDIGLSTHFDDHPVPDLAAVTAAKMRGETPALPYTLSDMAADAAALLAALGTGPAHVLGVSMGGMIAQVLAIEHPRIVASMTVVMTQSGNPELPGSDPTLLGILTAVPPDPSTDLEAFLDHSVALNRALGSPAYPFDEERLRAGAAAAAARAHNPRGAGRHVAASRAAPDRRAQLAALTAPTLVIHGAEDRLIPPVCGADVARSVDKSWLLVVKGMGHDLPDALSDMFAGLIRANAARATGGPARE